MDVRPPMEPQHGETELGSADGFFPWHADGPNFGWPEVDGVLPFMEMKVGYYLTDLTAHNSGAICVVRGSHRTSPWIDGQREKDHIGDDNTRGHAPTLRLPFAPRERGRH